MRKKTTTVKFSFIVITLTLQPYENQTPQRKLPEEFNKIFSVSNSKISSSFLRILSHLKKNSSLENLIFCTITLVDGCSYYLLDQVIDFTLL